MIVFDRVRLQLVTSSLTNYRQSRTVLSTTSMVIPAQQRIALLATAEDRRLLVNLIGGLVRPSSGRIIRKVSVSYPVGHIGGFEPRLPVRTNVEHLVRIYGGDLDSTFALVKRTAGLRDSFDEPFGRLSTAEKQVLGKVVAFSLPFDLYVLADDSVLGRRMRGSFAAKLFEARYQTAGMIIPTRVPQTALEYCDSALVLRGGKLRLVHNIERALELMHSGGPDQSNQ